MIQYSRKSIEQKGFNVLSHFTNTLFQADEAVSCTVTVKAYNKAKAEIASASETFTVPVVSANKVPEIEFALPSSFTNVPNVYSVEFLLDDDYLTKILLADNLVYTVHT